ncbi:MAG: hypothetical protein ACK5KP_09805 [Paludibacteraceae bacterium]
MKKYLLILAVIFLVACSNKTDKILNEVAKLTQKDYIITDAGSTRFVEVGIEYKDQIKAVIEKNVGTNPETKVLRPIGASRTNETYYWETPKIVVYQINWINEDGKTIDVDVNIAEKEKK